MIDYAISLLMNRFKGDLSALVGEEEGEKMKMMKKKSLEITWNESAKIDAPVNIQQMPDSSHSHIRHSFILIL